MTDRPIIFSGPMVRALLAGRKTQTRRLATSPLRRCAVGDRLYVREGWCEGTKPYPTMAYLADGPRNALKYRPSIHMPRWASRLTLTVTDMRVQRLQEISEDDAIAEGLEWVAPGMWSVAPSMPIIGHDPRAVYGELWNSLHTKPGETSADNPAIVALTFAVAHGNIDRLAK